MHAAPLFYFLQTMPDRHLRLGTIANSNDSVKARGRAAHRRWLGRRQP